MTLAVLGIHLCRGGYSGFMERAKHWSQWKPVVSSQVAGSLDYELMIAERSPAALDALRQLCDHVHGAGIAGVYCGE